MLQKGLAYGTALFKLAQNNSRVIGLDGDTKNSTYSEKIKNVSLIVLKIILSFKKVNIWFFCFRFLLIVTSNALLPSKILSRLLLELVAVVVPFHLFPLLPLSSLALLIRYILYMNKNCFKGKW